MNLNVLFRSSRQGFVSRFVSFFCPSRKSTRIANTVKSPKQGTTKWPYNDSDCLDAEQFKLVADSLVQEAGVRPLLHISATSVIKNAGTVVHANGSYEEYYQIVHSRNSFVATMLFFYKASNQSWTPVLMYSRI